MRIISVLLALCIDTACWGKDYQLQAQNIAPDTYLFEGLNQDFTFANGGNIVNTGFIVTTAGVVVINSGPSKLYGEQMRAAIAKITDQPILKVLISKLHPDHFLGNQAFQDKPIATLAQTIAGIKAQGEMFTDNMYRMVGPWMQGTELIPPNETITPGIYTIGGHTLELIALNGHTASDLVIFDHSTGVVFAGGVVFHNRTPTTPHAQLDNWLKALQQLEQLDYRWIVPSHGPIASDKTPIQQTRAYIHWLTKTFSQAADDGLDMAELLVIDIPEPFRTLAVMPTEYQRSISHLYPDFEAHALPLVAEGGL